MKLFCTFLIAVLFFSCEKQDTCNSITGNWEFKSIENMATSETELFPDSIDHPIVLRFEETGEISISGTCNQGFGEYFCSDNSLEINGIAFTEMACIPINTWENYLYEINSTSGFEINSTSLNITVNTGYKLNFQKVLAE